MLASSLFSALLPSHPAFIPILKYIRQKYDILEIDPNDYGITEILLTDESIDWQAVRQEIETQVRNSPETGSIARKQAGSFYTPPEIVNYMVDEA